MEKELEFFEILSEIELFNDDVLLIPFKMKETNSGIIIPKSAQNQEVISVCIVSTYGPDVKNEELKKEGTVVIIPRRTGKWIPFEGELYILVKESDILGIMEDAVIEEKKVDKGED